METYQFIISGKVQNVFYRKTIQQMAAFGHIQGYVENLSDGRVNVVAFLYDSRYYGAGWILQLLALSVLAIIPVTFDQLFLAIGKSKWMTMGLLTQMFVIYLGIPIAFSYFEFPHVVMVIALAFIPRYFLCLWFARKIRILKLSSELKGVAFIIPGILLGVLVENILEFVN